MFFNYILIHITILAMWWWAQFIIVAHANDGGSDSFRSG